jgi:hypothetical protein
MTIIDFIREEYDHYRKKYRAWKDRTQPDPQWHIW